MQQFSGILAAPGGAQAAVKPKSARDGPSTRAERERRVPPAPGGLMDVELVVDLGVGIGSREWLRGAATCTALCCTAYALAPSMAMIPAGPAARLTSTQTEQARMLAISPLALGADTGGRMPPTEAVTPTFEAPELAAVNILAISRRGDGLIFTLERAGLGSVEAREVAAMVAQAVPPGGIPAGTRFALRLGRRDNMALSRPLASLTFRPAFDLSVALERTGSTLKMKRIPIGVDSTPLRFQGRVGTSLYRSALAAGAPAEAIEAYIGAVSKHVGMAQVGDEDRFDIILEHRRADTGERESGQLLLAGLQRAGARNIQLMQWTSAGRTQWFEASGQRNEGGLVQQPVPGPVTSSFGLRMHPVLGYARMHRGIDLRAAYGTPVVAAGDGRVDAAAWGGGFGRLVRLNHESNLTTVYAHMSRIAVQPGQEVRQGQVIGYVGSTGLATGPHLHFELYRNGVPINPQSVRYVGTSQLSGAEYESFRRRLNSLLQVPIAATRMEQATTQGATPATLRARRSLRIFRG